jgi:hypothetical protein
VHRRVILDDDVPVLAGTGATATPSKRTTPTTSGASVTANCWFAAAVTSTTT